MSTSISNNLIVPQAIYDRLLERLDAQDAKIAKQEAKSDKQDEKIDSLQVKLRESQENLARSIRALDASLNSSRIIYQIVCAAGLAVAGGAVGLVAGPAVGAMLPGAITILEGAGGGVGLAMGASGGGAVGNFMVAPVAHNIVHKNQIQEREDLIKLQEREASIKKSLDSLPQESQHNPC